MYFLLKKKKNLVGQHAMDTQHVLLKGTWSGAGGVTVRRLETLSSTSVLTKLA